MSETDPKPETDLVPSGETGNAKEKHFEALFDGDEIDGKIYALGDAITGLDMPTQAYLLSIGRIAELSDEQVDMRGIKKTPRKRA